MSDDAVFADLIRRVRAGDQTAATELVREYEPTIRSMLRAKLTDPALRRLLDSTDLCQSVLAALFVEAKKERFSPASHEDLLKLLATMARNRFLYHAQKERAQKRDCRRNEKSLGDIQDTMVQPGLSVSELIANRELLEQVQGKLSTEERQLFDLHAAGRTWPQIAAQLGGKPDTLRMRLDRALERIRQEMNPA